MKRYLIPLIITIILISGCTQEVRKPADEELPQILKGVSLSPRSSSADDFTAFFEQAATAGEIVMWAGDWNELSTDEGGPKVVTGLAPVYGYIPLVEVTIHSAGELIRPLNETNLQNYRNRTLAFVTEYHPPYLGIGIEINSIYENAPDDFDRFVNLYNDIYDAIKEISPQTRVFTVFQLEKLKGHTLWSTETANKDAAQWFLLDRFNSDIVAFTTYPGLVHKNPADIAKDYYTEISTYTTKPIAFTEIGWHSEASPSGWESSEEEQADFIKRFLNLTMDLNTEVLIWSFMYDPDIIEPFRSMGLRRDDGTPRPAWDAWTVE